MSDDDPYLIPGTRVLRNKLGIADRAELDFAERRFAAQRTSEGAPGGDFDLAHLKAIHGHLFQDVYAWAGQVRTGDISKDGTAFQPLRFVESGMADVHRRVIKADYLRGLSADDFARKAGEIIGDVNYVHPFREGNGRTQLEYLRQLGERAGHPLDPGRLDRDQWIAASVASHSANYAPMAAAIGEQVRLERERQSEPAIDGQVRLVEEVYRRVLPDQPEQAAKLVQEFKDALGDQVKKGHQIQPPQRRPGPDISPTRPPPERDR